MKGSIAEIRERQKARMVAIEEPKIEAPKKEEETKPDPIAKPAKKDKETPLPKGKAYMVHQEVGTEEANGK